MTHPHRLATAMLVKLGEMTNRTFVLPMVIVYPTSRCNSRCASCDWWKSSGADDLTLAELGGVASALPAFGTQLVAFSGGEPLLRPDVFDAAQLFRARGMTLHLLTSGLGLERCATEVARTFARVIVSIDAPTEALYHTIRGIDALATVEKGVARLQRIAPGLPVTARATLHRLNFRELPRLIDHAKAMALDGISFLPADLASSAFGRDRSTRVAGLALQGDEIPEFETLIDRTIADHRGDFESGYVAESPAKLRRLGRYYAALAGDAPFPPVACNAPWMSMVVEADGSIRPCFFHGPVGNVRHEALASIVARNLPAFRDTLDLASNPVCERCVCSMKTGWRNMPWQ